MNKGINPATIAAPAGVYSHGIEVPPNARWLYISGQVGIKQDGTVAASIEEQSEVAWLNILAILAGAGMTLTDVVKINVYLTKAENVAKFRAVRAKHLGSHRPASTLVVIAALANPEFLVEVEAIAAKSA